ncbi:MAG TPA: DMT family transporter [Sphingomonas sp.]|uniref:DMT family transporter n=1 Tax=Sphingomonas sp. TaxID=28214 RepID=UPI002C7920FA|nr:DMT family transporter [Sphingomonas sp.]HMI19608.1 DMT family transporter [Sphingomonas sp.]
MNRADWATLLILSVLWGGSFFFIGIAIHSIAPITLVLLRVSLGAGLLWAWRIIRREAWVLPRAVIPALFLLALLNNALPFILFAFAQRTIPSGLASILNATTPIWGVIVAHLFTHDERMTPGKVAGVLLGFAGVAVMIGADLLGQIGTNVLAQLACLGSTLSYALAGVWGRRFRGLGVSPVAVATGSLSAAAIILLPLVLLFEPPWQASAPAPQAWMALAGLTFFSTAIAYILYFKLLASAGATNSLLVTFLIPVTAILLGTFVLGEHLAPRHFAGMALIGLGLAAIDGRLLRRR